MKKEMVKAIKKKARELMPVHKMKQRVIEKGRKKARVNEKVKVRKSLEEYLSDLEEV